MPLSRRHFLRSSALLSACSLTEIAALAAPGGKGKVLPPVNAEDETYWQSIRRSFPLSHDWTYLNNGTIGPSPFPVIEATRAGMMETDLDGTYGGYEASAERLAAFVGADTDEIALTHNVTEGINIACWGLPLKRGDEVILTTHEHVGNAFPWLNRQKLHGIVLKTYTPAATADETLSRIAALITKKTRAVATPHIPCTQGQVLPIKEICRLAKEKGIYSVIDGAHGPGMLPLDLHDIGCDTYASCCHKWMLGPKGTGFLYVRKDFQQILQPYFVGGGGDTGVWNMASTPIKSTEYAASAHRYYGGTQSLGLTRGVIAAIDFLEGIGMQNVYTRIKSLGRYTQRQLLSIGDKVELLTPTEDRSFCAVNGFRIRGVDHTAFFNRCMDAKIRIRSVAENGLNSLRVSTHIYNSREDVDKLVAEIKKVV
jgi:selenocysteine lyase/cysteine desulfurase